MSWFTNWWYNAPLPSSQGGQVDELDAMDKLQQSLKTLKIKRAKLNAENTKKQADLQARARACAKTKPAEARALIAQANVLSRQLQQMDGQIANLETSINMLESTSTSTQMVGAIKASSTSMKGMLAKVSVDDVEDTRADLEEVMSDASDINAALARPIGSSDVMVDEEIDAQIALRINAVPDKEARLAAAKKAIEEAEKA